jgi:hypothetical protein
MAKMTSLILDMPDHNGQVGAMGIAKMAGSTFIRVGHKRMVTRFIHFQDTGRAEFYTDVATLAPFPINENLAALLFFILPDRFYPGWF